jgi:hypothetical protein
MPDHGIGCRLSGSYVKAHCSFSRRSRESAQALPGRMTNYLASCQINQHPKSSNATRERRSHLVNGNPVRNNNGIGKITPDGEIIFLGFKPGKVFSRSYSEIWLPVLNI